MSYATVQDLVKRFGEREILELTDRDQVGEIDQAVAEEAISDASAEVDGYLGSRYRLPLEDPPQVLTRVTADIARYRLYDNLSTEEVRNRYEDAVKFLRSVAKGEVSLGVEPPPQSTGAPQVRPGRKVFSSDDLEGF